MAPPISRVLLLSLAVLALSSAPMMAQAVPGTDDPEQPQQVEDPQEQIIVPQIGQGQSADSDPEQGQQVTDEGGEGDPETVPSDDGLGHLRGPQQLRLGFMLPFPFGDSAVPPRLADEWLSTAKLALTLLAPKYRGKFSVEYYVTNSNCSRDSAEQAARALVADGVQAVVGPACSESVIGANIVLRPYNIPFISFAATADIFSGGMFSTFYRTSFPDVYQGRAIAAVVKQYGLAKLFVFHSNETYGNGLATAIASALSKFEMNVPMTKITVPHPPPKSDAEYQALFSAITEASPDTGIVLATPPAVTLGLLQAAKALGKLTYPWWYLGSDGATAFDLVGAGEALKDLAQAIQGEIGVAPYDGVDNDGVPEPAFAEFSEFWSKQPYATYPGLLTLPSSPRITRPRSFVVNLIDGIWAFHEAARIIVDSKHTISCTNLLACMRGKGPCAGQPIRFQGASGWVEFNVTSGDRLTNPEGGGAPTMYQVENLVGMTWQVVGSWQSGVTTSLQGDKVLDVTRPGPIPANTSVLPSATAAASAYVAPEDMLDASMEPIDEITGEDAVEDVSGSTKYVYNGGISSGTLIALILLSTVLAFTVIGGIIYWLKQRRNRDHQAYGRMI